MGKITGKSGRGAQEDEEEEEESAGWKFGDIMFRTAGGQSVPGTCRVEGWMWMEGCLLCLSAQQEEKEQFLSGKMIFRWISGQIDFPGENGTKKKKRKKVFNYPPEILLILVIPRDCGGCAGARPDPDFVDKQEEEDFVGEGTERTVGGFV